MYIHMYLKGQCVVYKALQVFIMVTFFCVKPYVVLHKSITCTSTCTAYNRAIMNLGMDALKQSIQKMNVLYDAQAKVHD